MTMHDVDESKGNLRINEQQRLLDAIWCDDPEEIARSGFDTQGIHIYRRNLLANAQRALTISFPTLFKLLDSDVGEYITKQFLQSSPQNQGDWAQWGNELANFIKTTEVGFTYPYLADCVALDWHIHCALHGVDQSLNLPSLQLLAEQDPEQIHIEFNSNVKLMKTKYPISEIFEAHHGDDESIRNVAMYNAKQALTSMHEEHTLMIYRPEFQPKLTRLTVEEALFIGSLMSGKSLGQSLNAVSATKGRSHFSFESWLIKAIEQNLIYNITEN